MFHTDKQRYSCARLLLLSAAEAVRVPAVGPLAHHIGAATKR